LKSEREEQVEEERQKNEWLLDLDNLPPQPHRWIDRGMKMTCEDAGHPFHEAWKRR
jgi:hypothetical protein